MGAQCLLGINGLEYPHWPIQQIADLAVALKASFVELGVGRITREGVDVVLREFEARHLTVEVNSPSSEIEAGMATALRLGSPYVIVLDDAIERADWSRAQSIEGFRRTMVELLEKPGSEKIQVALENGGFRITRDPKDVLAIVRAVNHPRFGVNYDPDNYYNAGFEGFPYAYELVRAHIVHMHAKDSAWYIPEVHGEGKRVLHRASGNVICVRLGTGAVNWAGLAERLKRDGYRGPISLEPHNLPHEMAPGMEADAAFLRKVGLVA
jgi:sugar phosphate isomerase/epimerase